MHNFHGMKALEPKDHLHLEEEVQPHPVLAQEGLDNQALETMAHRAQWQAEQEQHRLNNTHREWRYHV